MVVSGANREFYSYAIHLGHPIESVKKRPAGWQAFVRDCFSPMDLRLWFASQLTVLRNVYRPPQCAGAAWHRGAIQGHRYARPWRRACFFSVAQQLYSDVYGRL